MEKKYIFEDTQLLSKFIKENKFYENTKKAEEFCTDMNIKSRLEYYAYQIVLNKQLDKDVKYSDIEGFRRMKDSEYLSMIDDNRYKLYSVFHPDKPCILEVLPDEYFNEGKKLVIKK